MKYIWLLILIIGFNSSSLGADKLIANDNQIYIISPQDSPKPCEKCKPSKEKNIYDEINQSWLVSNNVNYQSWRSCHIIKIFENSMDHKYYLTWASFVAVAILFFALIGILIHAYCKKSDEKDGHNKFTFYLSVLLMMTGIIYFTSIYFKAQKIIIPPYIEDEFNE